jgi:hypothetical protein
MFNQYTPYILRENRLDTVLIGVKTTLLSALLVVMAVALSRPSTLRYYETVPVAHLDGEPLYIVPENVGGATPISPGTTNPAETIRSGMTYTVLCYFFVCFLEAGPKKVKGRVEERFGNALQFVLGGNT